MNPDYDRQTNPIWPNITDGPAQRARKIARMYRSALRAISPQDADACDRRAAAFGETWMLNRERLVEPDQELTTAEAAQLVNVHPDTIRKWACLNDPDDGTQKLLPRFKKRGRERTYLAGQVLEAATRVRRTQDARTRRI